MVQSRFRDSVFPCLVVTVAMSFASGGPCFGEEGHRPQKGILDTRHVDGSFGFSIRPFSDANLKNQKIPDPVGGYQLVEFVHRTRPWILLVSLDPTRQSTRPEEFVDGLRVFWARRYKGLITQGKAVRRIAARPGAVWNGRYDEASGQWAMFEAAVQFNPREYFRITFKAPERDQVTAGMVFDVIVDSFEMVHSEVTIEILDQALERGRALLAPAAPIDFKSRLDPDTYFLLRRDGEDLGFAHVQERVETREGREGLRVTERGWTFLDGGLFRQVKNEHFVSADLKGEIFEMRVRAVTPAGDDRPAVVMESLERGIRENDKLLISYTEEPGDLTFTNDVLEVSGTYIPLGLMRMLPRMVPLDKPELYAFSSYNSARRGLVMRTFRVMGPLTPDTGTTPMHVYKVEDAEGMVPPAGEIFLDDRGFNRKIIAGEDTVVRTSKAQVDYTFGERLRAAEDLLHSLGLKAD